MCDVAGRSLYSGLFEMILDVLLDGKGKFKYITDKSR